MATLLRNSVRAILYINARCINPRRGVYYYATNTNKATTNGKSRPESQMTKDPKAKGTSPDNEAVVEDQVEASENKPKKPQRSILDELFIDPKVIGKTNYKWLSQKLAEKQRLEAQEDAEKVERSEDRKSKKVKEIYKYKHISEIKLADIDLRKVAETELPGWKRRVLEHKGKHGETRWEPKKRVARSTMDKIRFLHNEIPEEWTINKLSKQFRISFEAVRRILKSKYVPTKQRLTELEERHKRTHQEYKKSVHSKTRSKR